jgi:sacsin
MQVSPAVVRKLLADNASQLANTLAQQQQRWQQQQQEQQQEANGQPPAAVLLQYCLSDVAEGSSTNADDSEASVPVNSSSSSSSAQLSAGLLSALQQLDGLPLLPASDGSFKPIRLNAQRSSSSSRSRGRLPGQQAGQSNTEAVLYMPANSLEQQLLQQLPGQLLHLSVSAELKQQLLQIAAAGVSNIRVISCRSLDEYILPQLLPPAWFSQLEVTWDRNSSNHPDSSTRTNSQDAVVQEVDPQQQQQHIAQQQPQEQQQQPSREFVVLLWQWLSQRSDAADLAHWPLLPVAGGRLRLLQQPAQVSSRASHRYTASKG